MITRKERKTEQFENAASLAVFLLCAALTGYYLIAGYGAYLDADMSSELTLAQHLVKERTLVSSSWYYSTEIRLLATQLVYTPLMALFENNWQLVRTLGGLILMAMMAAAGYWSARQVGANRAYARLFAGLSICPLSAMYAEFIVTGTCYVPYAVCSQLVLGLYARQVRGGCSPRRAGWPAAVLFVLALLMGASSVRYLLCALLPLFGAALWQYVFAAGEDELRSRAQNRSLALAAAAAGCGAAGYMFAQKVLTHMLRWGNDYYSGVGYVDLAETDLADKLQLMAKGLLEVLGYQNGAQLFSLHGILNALILLAVFVAALLLSRFLCAARCAREQDAFCGRFAALMLCIAAGLTAAMFLLLSSMYADRYWIPVVTLAVPVLAAAFTREKNASFRLLAAGLLCVTTLVPAASCVKNSMAHPEYVTDKRMAAVEAIRERGMTKGYSTFWNANIVTELSDGEIEVVALEMTQNEGEPALAPYRWLEAEENFDMDRPEEPVFLLVGDWEDDGLKQLLQQLQAERVELDGWIHLYVIPTQRALFEALPLPSV